MFAGFYRLFLNHDKTQMPEQLFDPEVVDYLSGGKIGQMIVRLGHDNYGAYLRMFLSADEAMKLIAVLQDGLKKLNAPVDQVPGKSY